MDIAIDKIIDEVKHIFININKKIVRSPTTSRVISSPRIIDDLFKYEKLFYKTGKKSDFNILRYTLILYSIFFMDQPMLIL